MAMYNVEVGVKEMVAAALPMQEHWLPQSNLDLLLAPVYVGIFFCYKGCKTNEIVNSFSAFVGNLKSSLSQTLVSFYSFAGRLMMNISGEPELLCNNEGVEFREAYADVELDDVDLSQPDISVEGKIVPSKDSCESESPALFCVQVTSFKCGGIVVGCTFDHRVADAYSANMFFRAWSDISTKSFSLVTPTFRRSFLNPQRPYSYPSLIPHLYTKISPIPLTQSAPPALASKIYHLQAHHIQNLQSLSTTKGKKRSKLEAFCAYLWRMVAKTSLNCNNNIYCKLGVVVDGRSGLGKTGLPANYFGNVLSIPFSSARAEEIADLSLSRAADVIHECVSEATCEEHFRGVINWVELQRPEAAMASIFCSGGEEGEGTSVVVSSGLRFPLCELDFGWGKADFSSFQFPWGGETGYVMPLESPAGDGSWIVYMHLERNLMDNMEQTDNFVLIPFKWELLDRKNNA